MAGERMRIDMQSILRLTELADYVIPFAIRVVCDLGIADLLVEAPQPVTHLAELTKTHPPSLHRVLRALACKGIFTEVEPGCFGLTPLAQPLRTDHPLSLREAYPLMAADVEAWAHFDYSVRSGNAAFDQVHGQTYWEYMASHPEDRLAVDLTNEKLTRFHWRTLAAAYEWETVGTIVDVGGGNGAFLAGILARHPTLHGILFDMPHVVASAPPLLESAGVLERCEIMGGSFFERVPEGADTYMLKAVLPGFDSERALTILRVVRAAMRDDARLLCMEAILPPGDGFDMAKLIDLQALALAGGAHRTTEQLEALLAEAGFEIRRIIPTMTLTILEARPVP